MVVKGATDFIVEDGRVVGRVSTPDIPALEAIGGTGDTLTGMLSAFIHAGFGFQEAAGLAAKTNRLSGVHSVATPFTKIRQIIAAIPAALRRGLPVKFCSATRPRCGRYLLIAGGRWLCI